MEWNMLKESKKLYPHWIDKSEGSNFTKHLKILNNQQSDIRHKIKTIEWSRLLNKPLQIHKTQIEPYNWKVEFEVNVPRLKEVNIYKNPTIVDNKVINNYKVVNGYYYEGVFYENHSKSIVNTDSSVDSETNTHQEEDYEVLDTYYDEIVCRDGEYYFDLISKKYYFYENGVYEEVNEEDVPQSSLVYSESFIDNYSHFFRYVYYDKIDETIIYNYVLDDENNQRYKEHLSYSNGNVENNGKYELTVSEEGSTVLYYEVSTNKYYAFKEDGFEEVDDEDIVFVSNTNQIIDNVDKYYICMDVSDEELVTSQIPLIKRENISPLISNDKYVLEVYTYNDYHFLKGFPEIDFIDYNNNNIIDFNERNYDNLNIQIEKIIDKEYLTFRVHQFGIKLVEIFKDGKPIHKADFVVEKLGFNNKTINTNFAHIYNYNDNELYFPYRKDTDVLEEIKLDVDEYVWRLLLTDDDKVYDENGNFELKNKYDIEVTYYSNPLKPYNSEFDKVLRKTYVCEDSIFYHDVSLDMIGALMNVPRYSFRQPSFDTKKEEIEFYNHTYPKYCNYLNEDDYHYQKRLEYYIRNYNKIYFPCLELWKYFHIDSELVNRKVILTEQNYSYMRTLSPEENKYINELGVNKIESYYTNDEYISEEEESVLNKPKIKSIISPEDFINNRNGILIDDEGNFIRDIYDTPVRVDYEYSINENDQYVIDYENVSKSFYWYNAKKEVFDVENNKYIYQIKLTDFLSVVPNTNYQLRFCVKEYPSKGINLKLIYKNRKGDVREVDENTPLREDFEDIYSNNELTYSNYNTDWEIECEYICTDFLTVNNAQNIELCLESEDNFKISDITLQRITINHFDSEYMTTRTDYNSCVYDLYADFNEIPSNIKYDDLNIFSKILNRSLPLTKKGFFNFAISDGDMGNDMYLEDITDIYINDMLDFESGILPAQNSNTSSHTYNFNKYVKKGDYEIFVKPYESDESNIIFDMKIDIKMLVFTNDNHAVYKTITIDDLHDYFVEEENIFKIPFSNISNNSFSIKLYRDSAFGFKDFKLIRKAPLTMEELIR